VKFNFYSRKSITRIAIIAIVVLLLVSTVYFPKIRSTTLNFLSTVYLVKGNIAVKKGTVDKGISFYMRGLEFKPEDERIYNQLSVAFQKQQRYGESVNASEEAIRINPEFLRAYMNLAVTYRKMGHYLDSIKVCKRTLEVSPDFAKAYCSMGWAYEDMGNYDMAIECHKKALKMKPNYHYARYRLALCYIEINDNKAALKEYELLKEMMPLLAKEIAEKIYGKLEKTDYYR